MTFIVVASLSRLRHATVTIRNDVCGMKTCHWITGSTASPAPRVSDLLGGVDDATLIKLVLESVHEFDVPAGNAAGGRSRGLTANQTATLLVYCYALGIFGSEEIETRLPTDAAIRYICAGLKPDWIRLRRFRRDNTLLLLGILTRLLELIATKFGRLRPGGIPDRWSYEFREQALDRLRDAIHADTMATDQ